MARRIVSTAKPVETQAPLNAETGAPKPPITNLNPAQEPEADKAKSNVVAPEPDASATRKAGDDKIEKKPEGDKVDPAAREPGTRKTDPTGTPVVTAKPAAAALTPPADRGKVVTPPTDAQLAGKRFCGTCGRDVTGLKFCPDDGVAVDGPKAEAASAANAVAAKKPDPAPAKAEVMTPTEKRVVTPPALPATPVAPVAEWLVGFSTDDIQGPYTEEQITEAIKDGHVTAETQVYHPAIINWKPVKDTPFSTSLPVPVVTSTPPPLPAAAPPVAQTPTATATPQAPPAPVQRRCGNCAQIYPVGAGRCGNCGHPLPQ